MKSALSLLMNRLWRSIAQASLSFAIGPLFDLSRSPELSLSLILTFGLSMFSTQSENETDFFSELQERASSDRSSAAGGDLFSSAPQSIPLIALALGGDDFLAFDKLLVCGSLILRFTITSALWISSLFMLRSEFRDASSSSSSAIQIIDGVCWSA